MSSCLFTRLLICLLITGCAANPASGGRTFSLVTAKEERALGESSADIVLKAYGLYRPESATTKYVDDLCNRTFAATESAAEPVQCDFVDDGAFNASATPGYMLVNRGLLPFLNSEAELVAVLGHESGHLTARHINQAATQAKMAGFAVAVVAGVVAVKANSSVASTAALGAGGVAASIGLSAFSRAHETEADALGRRYMAKMGYDARESVRMVRAMQMYDEYQQKQAAAYGSIAPTSLLDKLKSSHPATPDRLSAALAATGEPADIKPEDDTGRQRFMAAISGLTFGPARRYGIARHAELVLTQQRTVIPLPEGTTTAYTSSFKHDHLGTWLIAHPQSGAYLTVTSLKATAGHSPAATVNAMLPYMHEPVARTEVGTSGTTISAYTATYHFLGNDKRYRLLAVPASYPVDEMLIITAVYPNETVMAAEDTNLFAILKNMRFLTEDQVVKYKQLELLTFTAASGDSVAHQAAKLPTGALKEDLFRALNSLPAPQEMQPGQLYKTVIDPNP